MTVKQLRKRIQEINFSRWLDLLSEYLFFPFWVTLVIFLRILNRIQPIQLGGINAGRLGHLVMDVEMFLSEKEIGAIYSHPRMINLRYVGTGGLPISNCFILNLWKQKFSIGPRCLLQPIDRWNRRLPGGNKTVTPWRKGPNILNQHNDYYGALRKTQSHLPFTPNHAELAEKYVAKVRPHFSFSKPFICLHVRDQAYFQNMQQNFSDDTNRNASIADYEPAIRYLLDTGYQVVRLGSVVESEMPIDDENFWDYATDGTRTEMLDVMLASRCEFFISTLSGPDKIAQAFRRPILFTNLAPLKSISLWMPQSLIAPKRIIGNDCKPVPWSSVFNENFYHLGEKSLKELGFSFSPNTPIEILESAREMVQRLRGTYIADKENDDLWNCLLAQVPSYLMSAGIEARFSSIMLSE